MVSKHPKLAGQNSVHGQTGCAAAAGVARRMAVHQLVYSAGSVGVLRVDLQGVQALQQNDAVDAVYVYLRPASMDDWAEAQSHRQTSAFTQFLLLTYMGQVQGEDVVLHEDSHIVVTCNVAYANGCLANSSQFLLSAKVPQ